MKKIWVKVLIFAILIGATIWAGKGIFKYSIFSTHDGDHHIARIFDAVASFKEGEFPLRWAGSLNYSCGVPIFNFYYPFIYYLAVLGNLVFKDVIFTLKIINFLALLIGTFGFYLWAKEETGKSFPAIAGALVYLFAPYKFLLTFVRGSPEYLAYAILPIVLFLYAKVFNSKDLPAGKAGNKFVLYAFFASVMGAVLTISHNFTVMFLMPIILLYLVVKIILLKLDLKKIGWLALSFVGSFGMGSFFIGPAILEQKYTQIGANFIMWRDHFPELWQIWNSKWEYFYSSSGTINDHMSFMLGYAQWLILGIAGVFLVYRLFKTNLRVGVFIKENIWILIFFLGTLFTLYLILPWSIPVWEKLPLLQEIQFSWRLLGVAVFTLAALFVFVLDKMKSKYLVIGLAVGVSLFAVVAERNHLLPQPISVEDVYRYDDFEKLHPHRYSTTTLGDEIIAPTAEKACWFDTPVVATNNKKDMIDYKVVDKGNTYGNVKFENNSMLKGDKLVLGLSYFPGIFKIGVNGGVTDYSDCGGLICFGTDKLGSGANFLSWKVGESQTELFFDWLTIGFFVLWIVLLFVRFSGIYKDKKKTTLFLLILLIFGVFMFFRTYNINGRVGIGWDQERDARAAINILSGHFTLLGPRVQGPMGFFLPPYFFYLLAPFYAITHLSAYATTFFIGFWSMLFFTFAYLILSKVFNNKIALIFLALWAVNPLAVSIDTIAWNPVIIPLFILVIIYLVHSYFMNRRIRDLFLIGLVFGVGASFHTQFLFVSFLLAPVVIDVIKNTGVRTGKKTVCLTRMAAGFFIPFLPILLFDLRHNFLNTKLIFGFLGTMNQVNRVLPVWDNAVSFMLGIDPVRIASVGIYFLGSILLFWLGRTVKDKIQRKIFNGLGIMWVAPLPVFHFLVKNPSEYYFNCMLVIAMLLVAYILSLRKIAGIAILFILVVYFSWRSSPLQRSARYNLRQKDSVVLFLQEVTKDASPFNVSFDVPANEDTGFRYLLDYHGVKYSGSSKDPLIEFVIPSNKRPVSFVFGDIGVFFPPDWLKDNWVK